MKVGHARSILVLVLVVLSGRAASADPIIQLVSGHLGLHPFTVPAEDSRQPMHAASASMWGSTLNYGLGLWNFCYQVPEECAPGTTLDPTTERTGADVSGSAWLDGV